MASIVVIGGGWAGCGAAITARKLGMNVTLLERTDMLLGTGLAGGIMRNNGRWTATEEAIAMGGGAIFKVIDDTCKHKNIEFPGQENVSVYDVNKIEPNIRGFMTDLGIDIKFESRVTDVILKGREIEAVVLNDDEGKILKGDIFVEATGSAGPLNICNSYGNGCAMCVLRCLTFGGRVSVAFKAGVKEVDALGSKESLAAMSGSCLVSKDSLSKNVVGKLNEKGVLVVKIPEELRVSKQSDVKACPQYGGKEFIESLVVLDAGCAKLMVPFFPLNKLRKLPGFENGRYIDPLGGTRGNSVRYASISPREISLKVKGIDNLFCGGEKTGPVAGHTEAIITGTLAGYNAARAMKGKSLITVPKELLIGDFISFVGEQMETGEGLKKRFTFSGSIYFERMRQMGFYTKDKSLIRRRVRKGDFTDIFLHS
jgi:hypothetical protein